MHGYHPGLEKVLVSFLDNFAFDLLHIAAARRNFNFGDVGYRNCVGSCCSKRDFYLGEFQGEIWYSARILEDTSLLLNSRYEKSRVEGPRPDSSSPVMTNHCLAAARNVPLTITSVKCNRYVGLWSLTNRNRDIFSIAPRTLAYLVLGSCILIPSHANRRGLYCQCVFGVCDFTQYILCSRKFIQAWLHTWYLYSQASVTLCMTDPACDQQIRCIEMARRADRSVLYCFRSRIM